MKFTLLLAILLYSQNILAQTDYFDRYLQPVNKAEAYYYAKTENQKKLTLLKLYYVENDQLAMEGLCSELRPRLVREGKHVTYYKNGQVATEGEYTKGMKTGTWKYYYQNGQQTSEERFEEEAHLYIQRWDEEGKPLLTNGTGKYFVSDSEGGSYFDVVDHKLRSSFNILNASDTVYTVVEETAQHKNGMEGFYRNVGSIIRYPKQAKRMGIEGKVFVEFVIDKGGKITDVKALKGIGAGCDEEAVRVVSASAALNPGLLNGKPVKQRMVLPISFRLN